MVSVSVCHGIAQGAEIAVSRTAPTTHQRIGDAGELVDQDEVRRLAGRGTKTGEQADQVELQAGPDLDHRRETDERDRDAERGRLRHRHLAAELQPADDEHRTGELEQDRDPDRQPAGGDEEQRLATGDPGQAVEHELWPRGPGRAQSGAAAEDQYERDE